MFWALVTAPVTMCTFTSRRTPAMPRGSAMPFWSSTMNSWGRVWMTSRSRGMATALAASMTRSTSFWVTSPPLTAMTPWELKPMMWLPAIPAYTERIWHPAMSSASSRAFLMDCTVCSMFTTTPLRRPVEGLVPTPTTSTPSGVSSPTTAQILVVPMSSPDDQV